MEDAFVINESTTIIQALTQGGVLILLAVLIELRGLIRKWFQRLISNAEAEYHFAFNQESKRLLNEAIDTGIGAVAEWVRSIEKTEGKTFTPTSVEKLGKARDVVVSHLGRTGSYLKDYNLSEQDLDDLIHARLVQLRPMLKAGQQE